MSKKRIWDNRAVEDYKIEQMKKKMEGKVEKMKKLKRELKKLKN